MKGDYYHLIKLILLLVILRNEKWMRFNSIYEGVLFHQWLRELEVFHCHILLHLLSKSTINGMLTAHKYLQTGRQPIGKQCLFYLTKNIRH